MANKQRIILGLMTFGPEGSMGASVTSLDDFNKVLDTFQARGFNEIDTARGYCGGRQEGFTRRLTGREGALSLLPRSIPIRRVTARLKPSPGYSTPASNSLEPVASMYVLPTRQARMQLRSASPPDRIPPRSGKADGQPAAVSQSWAYSLFFRRIAACPSRRHWRPWISCTRLASSSG